MEGKGKEAPQGLVDTPMFEILKNTLHVCNILTNRPRPILRAVYRRRTLHWLYELWYFLTHFSFWFVWCLVFRQLSLLLHVVELISVGLLVLKQQASFLPHTSRRKLHLLRHIIVF